jgi:predicted alpha-1,2-mannosidase
MVGHHECIAILDAYRKGYRDFDLEEAYEAMKKYATGTTMLTRARGDYTATELDSVYYEKGFFPALPPGEKEWVPQVSIRRMAVAITLENCYDDWALAQLAKILDKKDDYEYFMKRAQNYKNVFDTVSGFMRPKTADGNWIEPFDPIWSGGHIGRDYFAENNGWSYLWFVPHDLQGLIDLMGGREKFIDKLDTQFSTPFTYLEKHRFLAQFPDMTGLLGLYSHGNENARYIPYLYNYAGAPWKTQKRVRDIMEMWYWDGPLGICGDEDEGLMSAWYVMSAIGIYTVCPGLPYYTIGSPIFEKSTIDVGNGNSFIIEAKDVSAQNKYIQSAKLNGKPLERPWFEHADLANGGSLVLQMGPRPNKQWGSAPEDAPPSSLSYNYKEE